MSSEEAKPNRREALKILLLASAGAGIALFGSEILHTAIGTEERGPQSTSLSTSRVSVKVIYIGMPYGTVGSSSESIVMSEGSTLNELVSILEKEHPALSKMGNSMQILLNGMAPDGNPMLHDGDEVDFLPFSAGG